MLHFIVKLVLLIFILLFSEFTDMTERASFGFIHKSTDENHKKTRNTEIA